MDERRLLELVQDMAAGGLWQPSVRHDSDGRWYELLDRSEAYEAWLLGWPQDHGIELHDHGASAGAFAVVAGSLTETYLDARRPRAPRRLRQRRWNAGEAVAFGSDHVHDLINVRAAPALSVHVYAPPLSEMTYYGSRLVSATS